MPYLKKIPNRRQNEEPKSASTNRKTYKFNSKLLKNTSFSWIKSTPNQEKKYHLYKTTKSTTLHYKHVAEEYIFKENKIKYQHTIP